MGVEPHVGLPAGGDVLGRWGTSLAVRGLGCCG